MKDRRSQREEEEKPTLLDPGDGRKEWGEAQRTAWSPLFPCLDLGTGKDKVN